MASKRLSPLEDPPAASLSSSEEEDSDGIEEEQEEEERTDVVEEEQEEEERTDVVEEEEEKSSEKKSTVKSVTDPRSQSESDSDSDAGSDFDSEQTQRSPTASDFTIKPIISKPIDDPTPTKPEKPGPKPGAKRPAETEPNEKESRATKKTKTSNGDEEDGVEETGKKGSGIQRLWSEDDEIAILKGMIDYNSKKGADPYADMGAFHEFLKKSLHVDVSKAQLMDKIRRLKKKYKNNVERGENGQDPVFAKPHEFKSFELSKRIWGGGDNNAADDHIKNKSKARNNVNASTVLALPTQEMNLKQREASNGELKGEKREEFCSLYPNMNEAVESGQFSGKSFMKERLGLIRGSKAKELEEKWKKLKVDEMEVYLKRVELIQEQTKLILDSMKWPTS